MPNEQSDTEIDQSGPNDNTEPNKKQSEESGEKSGTLGQEPGTGMQQFVPTDDGEFNQQPDTGTKQFKQVYYAELNTSKPVFTLKKTNPTAPSPSINVVFPVLPLSPSTQLPLLLAHITSVVMKFVQVLFSSEVHSQLVTFVNADLPRKPVNQEDYESLRVKIGEALKLLLMRCQKVGENGGNGGPGGNGNNPPTQLNNSSQDPKSNKDDEVMMLIKFEEDEKDKKDENDEMIEILRDWVNNKLPQDKTKSQSRKK